MTVVCVWWGPVWDLACVTQIGYCVMCKIRLHVWWLAIIKHKNKSVVDNVSSSVLFLDKNESSKKSNEQVKQKLCVLRAVEIGKKKI